jgi:predicted DNA-binding protein with PD1-like motif
MEFKLFNEGSEKTFAVVFDKGDEIIWTFRRFVTEQQLRASHFTAIGALSDVVLGFFDPIQKQYNRIPIHEQVEVLSLIGDVTIEQGTIEVHAHIVVGKRDGTAHGGHLLEGHVFPTLELILSESPTYLTRRRDIETGLALIDLKSA